MRKYTQARYLKSPGFTLIELLVVLGIIVILASVTIPAIDSTLKGGELTQATAQLVGFIKQARQYAITNNHRVEVCFYEYANTDAGESVGTPATWKFRAFQAFSIDDTTGAYTALTPVQRLPFGIIINSTNALSTLLNTGDTNLTYVTTPVAPHLLNSSYVAFHFQRDGSTDLPLGKNYFVTLHTLSVSPLVATPPKNYATLSVDQINGAVSVYRP